jgi:hypothetical protein
MSENQGLELGTVEDLRTEWQRPESATSSEQKL